MRLQMRRHVDELGSAIQNHRKQERPLAVNHANEIERKTTITGHRPRVRNYTMGMKRKEARPTAITALTEMN